MTLVIVLGGKPWPPTFIGTAHDDHIEDLGVCNELIKFILVIYGKIIHESRTVRMSNCLLEHFVFDFLGPAACTCN